MSVWSTNKVKALAASLQSDTTIDLTEIPTKSNNNSQNENINENMNQNTNITNLDINTNINEIKEEKYIAQETPEEIYFNNLINNSVIKYEKNGCNKIKINILTLLQIVENCNYTINNSMIIMGGLLGYHSSNYAQINHSVPWKIQKSDSSYEPNKIIRENEYQLKELLHEIGDDVNTIGWYQGTLLGKFSLRHILDFYDKEYDNLVQNPVIIIYDPILSLMGKFGFRAFQFTSDFLEFQAKNKKLKKNKKNHRKNMNNDDYVNIQESYISPDNILKEVDLIISDIGISYIYTNQLIKNRTFSNIPARLSLTNTDLLEHGLEAIYKSFETISNEHYGFFSYTKNIAKRQRDLNNWIRKMSWQNKDKSEDELRNEAENNFPKVQLTSTRLISLLNTNQIKYYCKEVDQIAEDGLKKLYLAGSLQKKSS